MISKWRCHPKRIGKGIFQHLLHHRMAPVLNMDTRLRAIMAIPRSFTNLRLTLGQIVLNEIKPRTNNLGITLLLRNLNINII